MKTNKVLIVVIHFTLKIFYVSDFLFYSFCISIFKNIPKMCVEYIEKYMRKEDTVLDIGTGSGILAICAGLFGAKNIEAIDIDYPEDFEIANAVYKEVLCK